MYCPSALCLGSFPGIPQRKPIKLSCAFFLQEQNFKNQKIKYKPNISPPPKKGNAIKENGPKQKAKIKIQKNKIQTKHKSPSQKRQRNTRKRAKTKSKILKTKKENTTKQIPFLKKATQ